jgi:hypothetical protein
MLRSLTAMPVVGEMLQARLRREGLPNGLDDLLVSRHGLYTLPGGEISGTMISVRIHLRPDGDPTFVVRVRLIRSPGPLMMTRLPEPIHRVHHSVERPYRGFPGNGQLGGG